MITLKQLVAEQSYTGKTDIQIIKEYFIQNNMEEEAIDIISEISKVKISKLKNKHQMSEIWVNALPSKYLYENYDLDIADRLHSLELNYIVNGGYLSKSYLKWAKENIPNITMPEVYFQPLIEYLSDNKIDFLQ